MYKCDYNAFFVSYLVYYYYCNTRICQINVFIVNLCFYGKILFCAKKPATFCWRHWTVWVPRVRTCSNLLTFSELNLINSWEYFIVKVILELYLNNPSELLSCYGECREYNSQDRGICEVVLDPSYFCPDLAKQCLFLCYYLITDICRLFDIVSYFM